MDKQTYESGLVGLCGMQFSFNINHTQDNYNLNLGVCPMIHYKDEKKWGNIDFKNMTKKDLKDIVNAFYELADWLKEGYIETTGENFKRRKEEYINFAVSE